MAPTAAAASIAFAPEIVIPCVKAMKARYPAIYTRYGFLDAFNPTLTETGGNDLLHGDIHPGVGWIADDYLGIDQGPIVIMIENHKSDLVWRLMRTDPHLRRGLERAGFSGGWLSA
nr:glucoamylase family protein [Brevundimonas denitrificans]